MKGGIYFFSEEIEEALHTRAAPYSKAFSEMHAYHPSIFYGPSVNMIEETAAGYRGFGFNRGGIVELA